MPQPRHTLQPRPTPEWDAVGPPRRRHPDQRRGQGLSKGAGKGNDKGEGAGKGKLRPDAFLTNAELLERRAERQRRRLGYQ